MSFMSKDDFTPHITSLTSEFYRSSKKVIADMKTSDINGDGFIDYVYLIGEKSDYITLYIDKLQLLIVDGMTNIPKVYPLEFSGGYSPKLFLEDFNGNTVSDILIHIPTGGIDGYSYNYLFDYMDNTLTPLFNAKTFSTGLSCEAIYKDFYKVNIVINTPKRSFTIDISDKKDFNKDIYDDNGRLLKPIKGQILALGVVYPVCLNYDKIFQLKTSQRIIGRSNADTLGYVNSYWSFKNNNQNLEYIEISI